ncbi:hypothetical protein AB0M12_05165 [Nocardia vinacea]|uniref:hypothetical protein n=1 Tax=Nocardia vinacea TaxID=96468 RepID=UPI003442AF15
MRFEGSAEVADRRSKISQCQIVIMRCGLLAVAPIDVAAQGVCLGPVARIGVGPTCQLLQQDSP